MLSFVPHPALRNKCAFTSQPEDPPKDPSTLNFGVRGGCVASSSTAQMCVYFADTGYELDTVLSPQKEQPCFMPADP